MMMNRLMKYTLLLAWACCTATTISAQDIGTEWHDLQVNEVNRLALHTAFFAYDTPEQALHSTPERSGRYVSLNGDWRFHWVADATERDTEFWRLDYDDSNWGTMPVPGNWELHGLWRPRICEHRFSLARPLDQQPA